MVFKVFIPKKEGFINLAPTLAVIIVILGAIFLPRFWGDLPLWGKAGAIIIGVVVLIVGFSFSGKSWPEN